MDASDLQGGFRLGEWLVEPLDWRGSADLRTLAMSDGLACFPAGRERFAAGEAVTVYRLRKF